MFYLAALRQHMLGEAMYARFRHLDVDFHDAPLMLRLRAMWSLLPLRF